MLPVNQIISTVTSYRLKKVASNRAVVEKWNDCPFALRDDRKGSKKLYYDCLWKGEVCKTFMPCQDDDRFPEDCPLNNSITIGRQKQGQKGLWE